MLHDKVDQLSIAIELAVRWHYGQLDKQSKPYIFHCLRVMMAFDDELHQIVGVLHDVIEDTELELQDLDDAGFNDEVLYAVESLTKLEDEDYFDYLDRVKDNPIALEVKLADIDDNVSRLGNLYKINRQEYYRLEKKYREARRYLYKR